ncbi:endonuclease domain-containing protein [Plantactinospora sp. KBS50]|uniref:endonuclease domain-containing protein n=1 Tax=Plantactinospora sp. KBS50 TaxID=2024580 RepID=UPI0035159250
MCCLETPRKALLRHRITAERYRELLRAQGAGCGICDGPASRGSMGVVPLSIDHDHLWCPGRDSCGRCVRDLLCSGCNGFLGLVELHGNQMQLTRRWIEAARAYLIRAGIDPWNPDRFAAGGRIHRQRRIKDGLDCHCYHCTGDPTGAGGWIAATIATGRPVWDEIIGRTVRHVGEGHEPGLRYARPVPIAAAATARRHRGAPWVVTPPYTAMPNPATSAEGPSSRRRGALDRPSCGSRHAK